MILKALEESLTQDPRKAMFRGVLYPKDLIFTQRAVSWMSRLTADPSEDLLIAAWGHVVGRWKIARDQYPQGTHGYHQYRYAQTKLSCDQVERVLREKRFPDDRVKKIRSIMMNRDASPYPEGQMLEDALCLAFLELKFEGYISEWGEEKYSQILKNTWSKMSGAARELALKIDYSPEGLQLLKKALGASA